MPKHGMPDFAPNEKYEQPHREERQHPARAPWPTGLTSRLGATRSARSPCRRSQLPWRATWRRSLMLPISPENSAAGCPGASGAFSGHSLRASFVTSALDAGVDPLKGDEVGPACECRHAAGSWKYRSAKERNV
jgi:hypothetical protein